MKELTCFAVCFLLAIMLLIAIRPSSRKTEMDAAEWLMAHNCRIEQRTPSYVRVEVPDEIDAGEATDELRCITNLKEIYFFSGEAKVSNKPYLRCYEWREEDAERVINQFRLKHPDVKLTFGMGAF